MSSDFYRAFEERYRGPRDEIKSRLRAYLPFVEPLKTLRAELKALDVGCGRGEWLEVLKEVGIDAHGVDLDEGMLAGCSELGLSVEVADGIALLKATAPESLDIVSAFHVAEHIAFPDLQAMVREALRVLRPAGLLIFETPNPENVAVGTWKFYLDPTHQRPIPPPLLSFLPEHYGFRRTKILRLQESPGLETSPAPTLNDVLAGVSPDYAVVAQKDSATEQLAAFDAAFEKSYGVTLDLLAGRYDARAEARAGQLEMRVQEARAVAQQAEAAARHAEATAQNAEASARQAEAQVHQAEARAQQAEARVRQAEATVQRAESHIQQLLTSKSWRFTAPLRAVIDSISRMFGR